jgi:3-hydroxybutyryl-CoA dehydrogenase
MTIKRIAVLGAGTMGHGIAHAAMAAGYETTLYDVTEESLGKALSAIQAIVAERLEREMTMQREKKEQAEAVFIADVHVEVATTTVLSAAVEDADFIIEAAPERIDVKLALMADIDKFAPAHAVIATNTSALSITEIAGATSTPGRVAGMHFFNPVHKMKLVEIVRALESTPEALQAIEEVAREMGKETVIVRESPGFITTRVNASIGNEAFYMLMEGVASARDIDKALKLGLNHPMGPFELVDLVGLDTRLSILEYLHRSLGEKYRPCPLLAQYVKAGRLGKKVGRGVYEY